METVNSTNKTRKPVVTLLCNGKDASKDFSKYLRELTFNEFEDEQSDELTLTLNNNDGYFSDLWYPNKGDKLSVTIQYGEDVFEPGAFTIDENSFNWGLSGDTIEIKALATSTNFSVRTQKIKNWSGYTLNKIAEIIGKQYGFKVLGNTGNVKIGVIVQKNESDIAFLKRISKLYGYIFNIKDGYLTFTLLSDLESGEALFTLSKSSDIESLSLNDTVTKIYGKATVQYLDLKSKTVKTYTAVGNTEITDTLTVYKRCSSLSEAKIVAQSALKNSSREVTGRIQPSRPNKLFMAGVNFDLTGIGKHEGKYHIKSHTLKIDESAKLSQEGEISKCLNSAQ